MIPLNIIPTGWYHIGWTGELAPGAVKPLKYFGQELVAFRTATGRLTVLDAFCSHLGAHLGYGGKVAGDCIVCPYHGWQWHADGHNTVIPYQQDTMKKPLRTWPVTEQDGMMFVWYDPKGGAPRWALPNIFTCFGDHRADAEDFYPAYPHAVVDRPSEPFPVQYMLENAADTAHFQFTHGAPLPPELLSFSTDGYWEADMGFLSPKTKEVALHVRAVKPNIGLSYTFFDGKSPYRLVLSGTPIDARSCHMRVTYYLPRRPESPEVMPAEVLAFAASTNELYEEDARMWRHQQFRQRPVYARQDIKGYTAYRKWCEQFYEGPATEMSVRFPEDASME
jgi:phenylpropionate dioxygenase-like ring-hydroxylating dioxygenase large terminal subunit